MKWTHTIHVDNERERFELRPQIIDVLNSYQVAINMLNRICISGKLNKYFTRIVYNEVKSINESKSARKMTHSYRQKESLYR